MEVIVEDGSCRSPSARGPERRLAAKLTGWRIDIKRRRRREVEAQFSELRCPSGESPASVPPMRTANQRRRMPARGKSAAPVPRRRSQAKRRGRG
jgi:transcription antitermination factor NusA-like protein